MRIAIVEDNIPLADGIAKAFEADGHGVDQLHDGASAVGFLCRERPDLIILDVNLPGMSGLEVLKELRMAGTQIPVIILTARGGTQDKITGLDIGADDYLAKPFELAELKARARALLRRGERQIASTIRIASLEFDPIARMLRVAGREIELPRREIALAEILIKSHGRIISKRQICDHVYGSGADIEDGTIELYVHRLRKKIAGSGAEIKTARGLGYCVRPQR
ncbi:MAG: response regulator transcription factor [Pseudomonadota bacterium]